MADLRPLGYEPNLTWMEFFKRRLASPEELLEGERQMREAQQRLEVEVRESGILSIEEGGSRPEDAIGNGPLGRVEGEQNPLTYPVGSPAALGPDSSEATAALLPVQRGRGEKEHEKEEATPGPQEQEGRRKRSEEVRSQVGVEEGRERTLFTMFTPPSSEGVGLGSGAGPLFDREQLGRLTMLQQQAPWLYMGGDHRGFIPHLPRPEMLLREEESYGLQARAREAREASLREQEEEKRRYENMKEENTQLKRRLEKLEETLREERYSTPQGVSKDLENEERRKEREEHVFEDRRRSEKAERREEQEAQESRGREGETGKGSGEATAFQVMLKLMEGMQQMQRQFLEGKEEEKGGSGEYVRSSQQLPSLAEWTPSTGPIDLNDWLALIEPMMCDLTSTSGDWWKTLMEEASQWYQRHMKLAPLDRISHDPVPSERLNQPRWSRLERRASTLLLMALPEGQREDLISSKRLTALRIVCHLLVTYQPGGLAEKEVILRQLESPGETTTLGEAVQALRKWSRWRRRASELGVSEPDPFLLLKGLNKIIRRPLEANRDLSFRISLARSTLQVDATPTSSSVTSFAMHLLAEFEQVAHHEVATNRKKPEVEKMKQVRLKKFEEEGGKGAGGKGKDKGGDREQLKCRFYLSEGGCKKGKECQWSHDQRDERRRCWNCGGVDHMSPACTRPKTQGDGVSPPKTKGMKSETEESAKKQEESSQEVSSMKDLLEEANKMLKSLSSGGSSSSGSSVSGGKKEDEERDEVVERLQQQLNALKQKAFKLSRLIPGSQQGLIDSGATHALRPEAENEETETYKEVSVALANGSSVRLKMSQEGVMVTKSSEAEPIVPMGVMVEELQCKLEWNSQGLQVHHPTRGKLPVDSTNGCPQIPKDLALEIIKEIEEKRSGVLMKKMERSEEEKWLRGLVEGHPVLKELPSHIKSRLVVEPGSWGTLPANKRLRKKMRKEGFVAYLYSGPQEGFTLSRALKQLGGDQERLLEIDIVRGSDHDVLADQGPYSGLLQAALEGKLRAIVGSPNCRTRSVLRHYPVEGRSDYPKPVRSWKGGEYGKEGLSEEERRAVEEDDLLLWRLVFLAMVARYVAEARRLKFQPRFSMEHPSSPKHYMPEVVSWWDTTEWEKLKEEFGWSEVQLHQGSMGGAATKPTTFGGDLSFNVEEHVSCKKEKRVIKSSKDLSRWSPGVMSMVASSLMEEVFKEKISIRALSWQEHIAFNHVPYRKDCLVCQESQQKGWPHRKVKFPAAGVLSLDTAGPLIKASDLGGYKAKYLLVGTFTWAVPKGSEKLKEMEEEEEVEDAPEIEDGQQVDEALGGEGEEEDRPEEIQEEEDEKISPEEQKEEEERNKEFDIRVFRMVLPMTSKNSKEVMNTAIEMLLRLRVDGYNVNRIHTDRGKEFMGAFKRWIKYRGIIATRTPGDDARSNGRVEVAVQSLKAQIRRTLRQAGVGSEWWPWAARYVNEVNRCYRVGTVPNWPGFLAEVLTRKRAWKKESLEVVMDKVIYLAPSWEDHGHWVCRPGEAPRVTRYIMKKAIEPVEEGVWLALEREGLDAMVVRRRLRGKTSMRKMKIDEEDDEREEQRRSEERNRLRRLIEEEMMMVVRSEEDLVGAGLKGVSKLRKALQDPEEEEDILQTRIVNQQQVAKDWTAWTSAVEDEVKSLLEEKEALKEIPRDEVEKMFRQAHQDGKRIELIPSKLVCTVKPGERGGRKKIRWVVCGNHEEKRDQEETYSGGADATAFRVLVALAQGFQWEAGVVDIKTAFLNAEMVQEEGEPLILIKPPFLLVDRKVVEKGSLYLPLRAIYGLRRSPRLWGKCRDEEMRKFKIQVHHPVKGEVELRLEQLESEPNMWRVHDGPDEIGGGGDLYGLVMTYVDDLFVAGNGWVVEAVLLKLRETWKTSQPEMIGELPTRFLGMEVRKKTEAETGREVWYVSQEGYIQEMLQKGGEEVKERKIPITKDQALMEEEEEKETSEEAVKRAQRSVGEMLWLVTRSRPDLMYAVSRMGSSITRAPERVQEVAMQVKGFLQATKEEGLRFGGGEIKEEVELAVYVDASFAPYSEESHGCFVVFVNQAPVFWRSGKQSLITLSTAEAEMTEIIEGMAAGEAVGVLVEELLPSVVKRAFSDSQSAVMIVCNEGGAWRTRHLRLRSAYARQAVHRGDWSLEHIPGESMVADLGTKPLTAVRICHLKQLLKMERIPKKNEVTEAESEVAEAESEVTEAESKDEEGREARKMAAVDVEKARQALQMITLAAAISVAKGEDDEETKEGSQELKIGVAIYTGLVIVVTLLIQWMWKVGVRDRRSDAEGENISRPRSLPAEVEEEGSGRLRSRIPLEESKGPSPSLEVESKEEELKEGRKKEVKEGHRKDVEQRGREVQGEEGEEKDPTASSSNVQEMSIVAQWEEIEREEEIIRSEVMRGLPHIMGYQSEPPRRESESNQRRFPTRVLTTKRGGVYHTSRACKHLKSTQTGASKELDWCPICQEVFQQVPVRSVVGIPLYIRGWGGDFHTNPECPRIGGAISYSVCSTCRNYP